ncbi:unnamed protein product, partial [marine sediment metagenome]
MAGMTDIYGAGDYDYWVLKYDSSGTVVWQKTYGGSSSDYARSIQQTSDGGYIVAGMTDSYGAGDSDFWVQKLDSSGNISGCGIIFTSTAIVTDTSSSITETPATGSSTSAVANDSSAAAQDSNANSLVICEFGAPGCFPNDDWCFTTGNPDDCCSEMCGLY